MSKKSPLKIQERCSFCEKARPEVECLIAGPPDIYICNECVDLCDSILDQDLSTRMGSPHPGDWPDLGIVVCAATLKVTKVSKDGCAEKAGIQVGDILEHDVVGVRKALNQCQPGGNLRLNVRRDDGVQEVCIAVGHPDPGKGFNL